MFITLAIMLRTVGPGLVLVSVHARLRGTAVNDRTNPITALAVGNLVPGLVYCVGQARGGSFRGVDQKRRCTTAAGTAGTQL